MPDARDGRATTTTLRGKGNSSVGSRSAGFSSGVSGSSSGAVANGTASSGARGASGAGLSGSGRSAATGDYSMRLAGIEARLSLMEMGARAGQISFSSMIDSDLSVTDLRGELKMKIGIQSDGKPGVTYHSGTAPPQPTAPAVSARQLYIVIGWDGEFVDATPRPSDLSRVDVHVSTEEDFDPSGATAVGSLFAEGVCVVPADIEDHWVRLVAVSAADVPSPATDGQLVRPLPADKIAAESIAAIHLASEIILSTTIVAGDPAGAHMELNSTGLRMVRADQTPTVVFSADEGNALITGSIQTALSGSGKSRIVFNPFPDRDWNEIRFYAPGDATWSSLFATKDRNGTPGALGVQGYQNTHSNIVMGSIYGEDNLLSGVFNLAGTDTTTGQTPFTDGMLTSPAQTLLIGSGGPSLIHNYKRPAVGANPAIGSYDPFVAWTDASSAAINGTSVLEFKEWLGPTGNRFGSIQNLGTDMGLYFGDRTTTTQGGSTYKDTAIFSLRFYGGDDWRYVPITASAYYTDSSEQHKTDIESLSGHLDPLAVVTAVDPVRFSRIPPTNDEPRVKWVPDLIPDGLSEDELPPLSAELAEARDNKVDGMIPLTLDHPEYPTGPEYGLIAEQVAAVAPDAVLWGGQDGTPKLNTGAVMGLLWGAVNRLSTKVDALEQRAEG